jgi:predicted ribosome quality control (RQC) complex YloA/Tae2 family protein
VRLVLDIRKSIDENAAVYFEKAKKAKRKVKGAAEALGKTEQKLKKAIEDKDNASRKLFAEDEESKAADDRNMKREWYEKFRWFISSDGMLCVGGRDATTNEILIKKHASSGNLVFHTELAGSPFFIIKNENKEISAQTKVEASIATAGFSRAWKSGQQSAEVYYIKPDQVSKEAKSGEFLSKGAFMIYGKRNHLVAEIELAVGINSDGKVMSGPITAVDKNCSKSVKIIQSNGKPSDAAKKIIHKLKLGSSYLDEVIRSLPAGGCEVVH